MLVQYTRPIVDFTIRNQLPAVSFNRGFAELGTLMSYGPDLIEMFSKAAGYLDRILTGAKPGDLPMELPTKFELVINLKTAKAFGVTSRHHYSPAPTRSSNETARVHRGAR